MLRRCLNFRSVERLHLITETTSAVKQRKMEFKTHSIFPVLCLSSFVHFSVTVRDHSAGLLFPVIQMIFTKPIKQLKKLSRKIKHFVTGLIWLRKRFTSRDCLREFAGLVMVSVQRWVRFLT